MCREGESAYMYAATYLTLSLLYIQFFQTAYYVELALPTSKLLIGSVYRPNNDHPNLSQSEQFKQSLELFFNLLSQIPASNISFQILGYFNVEFLKYYSITTGTKYIDLLFSFDFLEKNMLYTYMSDTLNDHVIIKYACENILLFILSSLISDHFP
jgi:hypothetical protein